MRSEAPQETAEGLRVLGLFRVEGHAQHLAEGAELHELLGVLRDKSPDFFKQLRMDVCALYLGDPAVWQRIKQRSRETWTAYLRAHLVAWTVTGTAALVVAGWTGHSFARAKVDASREKMVVSYLSNLDPRVIAKLRP